MPREEGSWGDVGSTSEPGLLEVESSWGLSRSHPCPAVTLVARKVILKDAVPAVPAQACDSVAAPSGKHFQQAKPSGKTLLLKGSLKL